MIFDKREAVMSRAYPSNHKIPEAFLQQLAAKQSPGMSFEEAKRRFRDEQKVK